MSFVVGFKKTGFSFGGAALALLLTLGTACISSARADISCMDYFTTEWANPLDMSDSNDILFNILPYEIQQINSIAYSGGTATFTAAGTDPWFRILQHGIDGTISDTNTTRYGSLKPIIGSFYKVLTFRMYSSVASDFQVLWNKSSHGVWAITDPVATSVGWHTYSIDLSIAAINDGTAPSPQTNPEVQWTNGTVTGLRIDPVRNNSGATIIFDWIQLTPGTCNSFPVRYTAPFIQPDNEGGVDFFTKEKGNPSNMSSVADIAYVNGLAEAKIYPGNSYVDSGGNSRSGDYFEGKNRAGDGDPQQFSIYQERDHLIDASYYKVACFTLDVLLPTITEFHSVARILWQLNGVNINGDDLLLRTTGESRYCLRLDTMPVEVIQNGLPVSLTGDYWRNNDDSSKISSWRIDAHEVPEQTTYRFADIRLAADHEAHQQFAVVLGGDRSQPVEIYKNTSASTSGGSLIGTLSANRTSDVLMWNTTAETDGAKYYLYSEIDGFKFLADGPVVINHSYTDSSSPTVQLDAPAASNYQFQNTIEIAGHALDNVRIATAEAFLDGQLIDAFRPADFRLSARNASPGAANASVAGFQRFVDISSFGFASGAHTFRLDVYDTAGNLTTTTVSVTKGSSTTAAINYDAPNEPAADFENPGDPGENISLSISVVQNNINFTIAGAEGCEYVDLLFSPSHATLTGGGFGAAYLDTFDDSKGEVSSLMVGSASNVRRWRKPPAKAKKKGKRKKKAKATKPNQVMYFAASCRGRTMDIQSIRTGDIVAQTYTSAKTLLAYYYKSIPTRYVRGRS